MRGDFTARCAAFTGMATATVLPLFYIFFSSVPVAPCDLSTVSDLSEGRSNLALHISRGLVSAFLPVTLASWLLAAHSNHRHTTHRTQSRTQQYEHRTIGTTLTLTLCFSSSLPPPPAHCCYCCCCIIHRRGNFSLSSTSKHSVSLLSTLE